MSLPFQPVNIGTRFTGVPCALERSAHFGELEARYDANFRAVIDGLTEPASVVAIFDNQPAAEQFLKLAAEPILALRQHVASVEGQWNVAGSLGLLPQRRYSLGFEGSTEKLPNTQLLALSTMCGHGMISSSLAKKMIDWVKEGRELLTKRSRTWRDSALVGCSIRSGHAYS